MPDMFDGSSGKLNTLLARLSAVRAALFDNLDEAISTRAPASTALSSATWTNARAGKLDSVIEGTTAICGTSNLGAWDTSSSTIAVPGFAPFGSTSIPSAGAYTTMVSVSGSGYIDALVISGSTSGSSHNLRVTVDGVVIGTKTVSPASAAGLYACLIGDVNQITYYTGATTKESINFVGGLPIPFKTSLLIEGYRTGAGSGAAYYRYVRTS